jgi:intraflagellar transport protein 81
MKKDDFRQYAASLRTKNTQFKSMKKQLEEIKSEVVVLDRTKQILKSKAGDVDEFLRDLEKKQGVQGFSKVEDQIQDASELKEKLDNAKSQSMQELTGLIQRIDSEVKEKKQRLAPEIKRLRTLRNKYTEIEVDYNERKRNYDAVCSQLESEKERMDKDMGTGLREFKESESKYH